MGHLLEVDDLQVRFPGPRGDVRAVDGVSLHVDAGEIVGLVGESGCGKTVLGLSLLRLVPEPGRIVVGGITLDGIDVLSLDAEALRRLRGGDVAMSFQDATSGLNPLLRIGTQVHEAMAAHDRFTREEAGARSVTLLDDVRIADPSRRAHDRPHQLSGGMRQRVMIAMGIANEPKLLVADEMTTALDVTTQAEVVGLIQALSERLGMAVLFVSHDLALVGRLCHRVAVMYAGRIVETGTVEAVFERPQHPYTWSLLRAVPTIDAGRDGLLSIGGRPPHLDALPPGCTFEPRCPIAESRCTDEEPPLEEVVPGQQARCWVLVGGVESPRMEAALIGGEKRCKDFRDRPSPSGEECLLRVDDVSRHFSVTTGRVARAVDGVSLELRRGEALGLIGESGCGKSTLARLVCGLSAPTSGRVCFDGTDLASLSGRGLRRARRRLQMVFQDAFASLDPRMRVGAIVAEPLANDGVPRRERGPRVEHLLDLVGLDHQTITRRPHELSGGQRQRVGIARALATEPDVVVCDEPVSALDVSIQAQVLNLLANLQGRLGLTFLLISHDLRVVRHLADRVAVMYLGRIVEVAETEDLFARPAHPYTRALLEAVLSAEPRSERQRPWRPLGGEVVGASDVSSGCRYRTRCGLAVVPGVCRDREPTLDEVGSHGRRCACHFAHEVERSPSGRS